jgi:hypothetical protein
LANRSPDLNLTNISISTIQTSVNATTARCGTTSLQNESLLSLSRMSRLRQGIKGLIRSPFVQYPRKYALDYCGNLADLLAAGTFVTYWRRPDSPNSGHRCHRSCRQAGYGSRSVVVNGAWSPLVSGPPGRLPLELSSPSGERCSRGFQPEPGALQFGHLQKVTSGSFRPKAKGAGKLSSGFQPCMGLASAIPPVGGPKWPKKHRPGFTLG